MDGAGCYASVEKAVSKKNACVVASRRFLKQTNESSGIGDEITRGWGRKNPGERTIEHGVRDEKTRGTRRKDTGYVTKRHGVRDERILVARAKGHGDQDGRTRDWGDRT